MADVTQVYNRCRLRNGLALRNVLSTMANALDMSLEALSAKPKDDRASWAQDGVVEALSSGY